VSTALPGARRRLRPSCWWNTVALCVGAAAERCRRRAHRGPRAGAGRACAGACRRSAARPSPIRCGSFSGCSNGTISCERISRERLPHQRLLQRGGWRLHRRHPRPRSVLCIRFDAPGAHAEVLVAKEAWLAVARDRGSRSPHRVIGPPFARDDHKTPVPRSCWGMNTAPHPASLATSPLLPAGAGQGYSPRDRGSGRSCRSRRERRLPRNRSLDRHSRPQEGQSMKCGRSFCDRPIASVRLTAACSLIR